MPGYQPTKLQLERLIVAFDQVKAENDPLLADPRSQTFVHTSVYSSVRKKRWALVVGGKGSGKTALLLGYQQQEASRFLGGSSVALSADDFPLEALFNFFYISAKTTEHTFKNKLLRGTDLPTFVPPARLAHYAWQNAFKYAAVYSAAVRLLAEPASFDLSEDQVKVLSKACRRIARVTRSKWPSKIPAEPSELLYALLIYFFESAQETIDRAIQHETESLSVLLATITMRLTSLWRSKLVKPIADASVLIHDVLHRKSLRVLITLDKFDDYYDAFARKYVSEKSLRPQRDFLAAILEGLVLASRELARDPDHAWIAGLIAIPLDKFLELHLRERVDLETEEGVWLRWTPHELFEYVNRRIAHALELQEVAGAWNHLFPFDVTNGTVREVKEDSFLYLVRHSHWRPREIQLYLRRIFQLMDETRQPPDEVMFRRAVKTQAEETIREEFKEEYAVEYPGLAPTLKKLETVSLKTVMNYDSICDLLSKVSLFDEPTAVDDTMLRLFHLGVIGVRAVLQGPRDAQPDATITQHRQEVAYRYYYNTFQTDPFSQGVTVAFHPMFFEFLNILHEEKYVVNQLRWEMFATPKSHTEEFPVPGQQT
jgi:hypothetical protein